MPKTKSILALGLILLLVMTGCQAILPTAQLLSQIGIDSQVSMLAMVEATPTVAPTEEPAAEPTALPTEEPAAEPTALPTEEPAEEPTALPTEEPAEEPTVLPTEEPAEEPTALPTEEPAEEPTVLPTEEPAEEPTVLPTEEPAEEPTALPTEEPAEEPTAPTSAVDNATVLVSSLRIRSGPGTTFDVIGGAVQGERYPVTGQALECQWYQIDHPQLGVAWIAGGDFAATDGPCAEIPAVDSASVGSSAAAPTTTDAVATPTPVTLQPTPTPAAGVVPTVAPAEEATAQPADEVADPFPTDKGCLMLQNQLGPELTFTFTSTDGVFAETVKVTSDADVPYCLNPGSYRVTVDAPPPWADINEEFTVVAGDRFFFPIRPQ